MSKILVHENLYTVTGSIKHIGSEEAPKGNIWIELSERRKPVILRS